MEVLETNYLATSPYRATGVDALMSIGWDKLITLNI